jgi:ubiquinone/menaquinone biosynthesis C-methylase UbiE
MIEVKQAYKVWADQYDTNENKTRDLEAVALQESLREIHFENCVEIGCGTGKNTSWLATKNGKITAIDLTEAMLAKARQKVSSANVRFLQADINEPWSFADSQYDLITCSLVLEHIENLDAFFAKAAATAASGGYLYVGELHPFKQYTGSKARFETEEGLQVVTCFNHHLSDFTMAAKQNGFEIVTIAEYFDDNDRTTIPRILTIVFKKN